MLGQEAERGGMSVPLTDILHYTLALVLPILTGAIIGTAQLQNQLLGVTFHLAYNLLVLCTSLTKRPC